MPKIKESRSSYLRQWISGNDAYTTDGKIIFCKLCSKEVRCLKKYHVDQHSKSAGHLKRVADSETSKNPMQLLLTTMQEKSTEQTNFSKDLCETLVAANIPWSKLSNPVFRNFLEKYTSRKVPDESTLRKNYLGKVYDEAIESIRQEIGESPIWLSIDETTDALGRYVANVVVGGLSTNSTKSRLILSQFLDATNHASIARTVRSALKILWPSEDHDDRLLLLVTDAAPYMVKAGKSLKIFYEKMIHLTCLAHGMHRVAEEVRNLFPEVNALISSVKKVFLKAPHRCVVFKNLLPETPLPPAPVVTRWGTWLEAALYYNENFTGIKEVINELCEEKEPENLGVILGDAKAAVESPSVVPSLGYIGAHFNHLPNLIKRLEDKSLSLIESVQLVEQAPSNFPGPKGKKIQTKIETTLKKNPGWTKINLIKKALEGEGTAAMDNLSPKEISCFKYAPITSCDVERSFSRYKLILTDRRTTFTQENLEKYIVANLFYV